MSYLFIERWNPVGSSFGRFAVNIQLISSSLLLQAHTNPVLILQILNLLILNISELT
jgi:hypothetical protein